METQETTSKAQIISTPQESDWKTLRKEEQTNRLVRFKHELESIQKQFGVELVPQITLRGSEVIATVLLKVAEEN